MKPTVGRIVHFHDVVNHQLREGREDLGPAIGGPFMAFVLAVLGDEGDVILDIRFPDGSAGGGIYQHAADDKPTAGCWNWPPRE